MSLPDGCRFAPRPSQKSSGTGPWQEAGYLKLKPITSQMAGRLLTERASMPEIWTGQLAAYRGMREEPLGDVIRYEKDGTEYNLLIPSTDSKGKEIRHMTNVLVLIEEPGWSRSTGQTHVVQFASMGKDVLLVPMPEMHYKGFASEGGMTLHPDAAKALGAERAVGVNEDWVGFPVRGSIDGKTENNNLVLLNSRPDENRGSILVGSGEKLYVYVKEVAALAAHTAKLLRVSRISEGLSDAVLNLADEVKEPHGFLKEWVEITERELGKTAEWGIKGMENITDFLWVVKANLDALVGRK